ncbi:MAG: CCA tRNA nucleotidyltransferase [Cellulosilyticaceae bacterium]
MKEKYNTQIPEDALQIIQQLEQTGYEAYIVGGCVRDMIMGRNPHDWDITTSAKPEQVKAVFNRTYDTGIEHGTVTVILNKEHFEVTTYRIEGEYKDHRRPENVNFVEDITEDLSRRDFTMNAIAYHPTRGFVDPYNGVYDIKNHIICSVRNAKERFTEDALRILRAVRFSAVLGFEIEPETLTGISTCKALLQHISKERIRDEFLKICTSDRPTHIELLYKMELLPYILPELIPLFKTKQNNPHHIYDVGHHTLEAMCVSPDDVTVRLALLFHDIGKPLTKTTDAKGIDHFYNHPEVSFEITKRVLRELRLDNNTIGEVSALVKHHDYHLENEISTVSIKHVLKEIDSMLFDKLLFVQEADSRAQNPEKLQPKLEALQLAKQIKENIIENKECYKLSMLALTGVDLIKAGVPKGKAIGETLNKLLEYVIENPTKNTKEQLLETIKH